MRSAITNQDLHQSHSYSGTYKKVTQENGMVIHGGSQVSNDIVLGLAGCQEIARNQLSSLVNQLVKRMLTIGSRFTPVQKKKIRTT